MTDAWPPPLPFDGVEVWPAEWPECLPRRMTLKEFLDWDCEGVHAEWVDGETVLMPYARISDQRIRQCLGFLIGEYYRDRHLGDIFFVPVRLSLPTRPSVREPDLLFISTAHEDRIKDVYIDGPADLVVEIVSPESQERDRATKFVEYEAAGVPEYWLIDSLRHEAMFYVLGTDGRYHLHHASPDGIYQSSVIEGSRMRPDWLWRQPLPTPAAARAELPA